MSDIERICNEAVRYKFAAVCIPPSVAKEALAWIKGSGVKLCTVIGFPFGYEVTGSKLTEIEQAVADGADELDVVINLIRLKSGDRNTLKNEMEQIVSEVRKYGKIIKVIIETGILTNEEIIDCCNLYGDLGVDYLKTSTGYAERGASVEAVRLMRKNLPANVKIKASGGIKTYEFAKELIEAGADRLGCSSSISIVESQAKQYS